MSLKQVGLIGVGLIGGSLALAMKRAFAGIHIKGLDPISGDRAVSAGIIDEQVSTHDAFCGCEWVVVATPMATIADQLRALDAQALGSCVVSEVSSLKGPVCEGLAGHHWRHPIVWCHPMAGKEVGGLAHADGRLLHNRPMLLMGNDQDAVARVTDWVTQLPMTPVVLPLAAHDQMVGVASHWPYLMAVLTVQVAQKMGIPGLDAVVSSGFFDTTRVAASPTEWGKTVLSGNQDVITQLMTHLRDELDQVTRMMGSPQGWEGWLQRAQTFRSQLFPVAQGVPTMTGSGPIDDPKQTK